MFGLGKKKKAPDMPVAGASAPDAESSEEDLRRFPQMSDMPDASANNVSSEDARMPFDSEQDSIPAADNSDDNSPPPPPFMAQNADEPAYPQQPRYPQSQPQFQASRPAEEYSPPAPLAPPVKGPVFVSLEKYREVKQMLYDLKSASADLRQIISDLKQNRDQGTDLLKQSVEKLSNIDARVDDITGTLRAG